MKFFVKLENTIFLISSPMAKSLQLLSLNHYVQDQNCVFVLNSSDLATFKIVPTTSSTHFYILISGTKYRISKTFFDSLNSIVKVNDNSNKQSSIIFDKYYTKPLTANFCVSTFASSVMVKKQDLIVEPSAGNEW